MNRTLFACKIFCACALSILLSAFIIVPAEAEEQQVKPRILSIHIDKAAGRQIVYRFKTSGIVKLPDRSFTLSNPNRVVLDFHHTGAGTQLASSCRAVSSGRIGIRSGHHKSYTRIVLDFGGEKVPAYRLYRQPGWVVISLERPVLETREDADAAISRPRPAPENRNTPDDPIAAEREPAGEPASDENLLVRDDVEDGETPEEDDLSPFDDGDEMPDDEDDPSLFDDESEMSEDEENADRAFHFSGSIKNKYARDTNEEDRFESDALNHFETIAKLTYDGNGLFSAELGVDVDAYTDFNGGDSDSENDIRFYEAYVDLSTSALNFRLGNQIVRWGKSDGYSPIDNVNPEDLRGGISGRREERKVPIPMANMEYNLSGTTFQGIYIPGFYKSDFDVVGRDWALFGHSDRSVGPFRFREEDHEGLFDSHEFGLRLSSTVRSLDIAFSYLSTRTDTPVIGSLNVPVGFPLDIENGGIRDIVPFALATDQVIPIRYQRQNIYGFEFETTISDFGVRGDVAYFSETSHLTDNLDQIEKPMAQYVLGLDYLSSTDFYVNLQFSHSILLDYEPTIIFQDENDYALSGSISQEFMDGELKLEFRGYYDLSGDAAMYNPQIIIKPWDNLSLEIGAELLSGSKQTLLGLFEENDQYYGTAKLTF